MCGENSFEVVFGIVSGKKGVKVLFTLDAEGNVGTSHSEIRSTHKLASTRRYVNANYSDGKVEYENGTPSWYTAAFQKDAEAQIKKLVTKTIPTYLDRLEAAGEAYDRAIVAAQVRANQMLETAKNVAQKALDTKKQAAYELLTKAGGK